MRTKIVIISLAVLISLATIVSLLFYRKEEITSPVSNVNDNLTKPTQALENNVKLLNYKDEAGFQFNYPENIKITNQTNDDPNAYSKLNLSSSEKTGKISINVIEQNINSTEQWLKQNITSTQSATIKDKRLASLKGKEIVATNQTTLIAFDGNILFQIDVQYDKNREYWLDAYNKIISSFIFVSPENTSSNNNNLEPQPANQGEDVIDEGEEVVE